MANRKNTFLIKRSNTPGKVPTAGDLQLGELALNTADVILYASGTTTNSILPIGWDRVARTGDTMTGNLIFSGASIDNPNYIQFNTSYTGGTPLEGRMYWDEPNGTVTLGMHGSQVAQQIGLEYYYYIKNQSGATIENGRVVRAVGTLGSSSRILGEYMIADGSVPAKYTLGIATEDIVNGDDGYVTEFGLVRNINTTGSIYGETWNEGDILYVSPSINGGLTNVRPTAPQLKIEMAIVVHTGATNGSIFVRPHRYPILDDIQNANVSGATEGDLLVFDNNTNNIWISTKSLNGQYTISGGLSSTTISASTYLGLPTDIRVTGGTYNPISGIATFTNNTGGTFTVSGFNSSSAATASYITGFTYNNANTFTLTDNSGATLSATINSVTGLTVNGNITVTGTSDFQGNFISSIIPNTNRALSLGDGTHIWQTLWSQYVRLADNSGNDVILISAPTLGSTPDPAWEMVMPAQSGGTYSLLGVYSGASNTSNTTWFNLSAGTNVTLTQSGNISGGTLVISSQDTFVTGVTISNGTLTIKQNQGQPDLTASTITTRELTFNSNDMALNTASRTTLTPLVMSVTRFAGTGAIDDAGLSFIIPNDYVSGAQFYFTWRAASTSANNAKIFLDLYTGSTNNLGSLTTAVETLSILTTPTNTNTFIFSSAATSTTLFSGGNTIHARIYRDPGDAGDTYTGDLDMINLNFKYNSIS